MRYIKINWIGSHGIEDKEKKKSPVIGKQTFAYYEFDAHDFHFKVIRILNSWGIKFKIEEVEH